MKCFSKELMAIWGAYALIAYFFAVAYSFLLILMHLIGYVTGTLITTALYNVTDTLVLMLFITFILYISHTKRIPSLVKNFMILKPKLFVYMEYLGIYEYISTLIGAFFIIGYSFYFGFTLPHLNLRHVIVLLFIHIIGLIVTYFLAHQKIKNMEKL